MRECGARCCVAGLHSEHQWDYKASDDAAWRRFSGNPDRDTQAVSVIELETNLREVLSFTITEEAPARGVNPQ